MSLTGAGPLKLVATGVVFVALAGAGCSSATSTTTTPTRTSIDRRATSTAPGSAAPTPSQSKQLTTPPVEKRVGVSLPLNRLDGFVKITGSVPAQLSIYQQWASNEMFDDVAGFAAQRRGMRISITWEPWEPACNCANQPEWSDRRIAAGTHDAYITAYARSVKAFADAGGGTVTLRLAHEMNGDWYPWGIGVNGNTAVDYRTMWRHVHAVFAREHVTNVLWMWAPNVEYDGATTMAASYPGAAYVDDVGLSGYNFGPGLYSTWQSFESIFQPSLDEIRAAAVGKPLYLAEIACASIGGNSPAWITDMFAQIRRRPYIAGFVWFDQSPAQRDWLIENDPAHVAAWRAGVASLRRT